MLVFTFLLFSLPALIPAEGTCTLGPDQVLSIRNFTLPYEGKPGACTSRSKGAIWFYHPLPGPGPPPEA
jgi:hypothetical protein